MGTGRYGEVERHTPDRRDVGVDVVVTRGCDDEPVGDEGCDVPGIVFIRGRDEKEDFARSSDICLSRYASWCFTLFTKDASLAVRNGLWGRGGRKFWCRASFYGTSSSYGSSACCSIWLFMMFL